MGRKVYPEWLGHLIGFAGNKVLDKVVDNRTLIVGNPQGVSDQQLRPRVFDNIFNWSRP